VSARAALALTASLLMGCARADAPHRDRGPATPLDPEQAGVIVGTVRLDGAVPPGTRLQLAGDGACTAGGRSEVDAGDVLVSAGRVENAFVYVARGLENRVFERPKQVVASISGDAPLRRASAQQRPAKPSSSSTATRPFTTCTSSLSTPAA
jgi:hypothetical protein